MACQRCIILCTKHEAGDHLLATLSHPIIRHKHALYPWTVLYPKYENGDGLLVIFAHAIPKEGCPAATFILYTQYEAGDCLLATLAQVIIRSNALCLSVDHPV